MKQLLTTTTLLIALLTLTSCASEPKDMVSDYVDAWAIHDKNKVLNLSDKSNANRLEDKIATCIGKLSISNEKYIIEKIFEDSEFKKVFRSFMGTIKGDLAYIKNKNIRKLWGKIGSGNSEYKSLNYDTLKIKLPTMVNPAFEGSLKEFKYKEEFLTLITDAWIAKIKQDYPKNEQTYKALVKAFFEDIASKDDKHEDGTVEEACINQIIGIENYKSLNIIEVKQDSVDQQTIKIETVMHDGTTKKSYVKYELINKEWKVIDSLFLKTALKQRNFTF